VAHGTDAVCRWVHRGAGGNVADTRVAERCPDRSYGNETVAFAGRVEGAARYVLLDFDIRAVLPAGAEVRSATLVVTALSRAWRFASLRPRPRPDR
jgi:hypothetical protein